MIFRVEKFDGTFEDFECKSVKEFKRKHKAKLKLYKAVLVIRKLLDNLDTIMVIARLILPKLAK